MADTTVQFVIKATNEATPEFQRTAESVQKLGGTLRQFGTATHEAQIATARMLGDLKASRAGAEDAAGGFELVHRAAHHAARGGVEELLGQIPVVGSSLAAAARGLGGFALALGGIVGAGVGVIAFMKSFQRETTETLNAVTNISEGIGAKFRVLQADVRRVRAQAAEDVVGEITASTDKAIAEADREKEARIRAADQTVEGVRESIGILDVLTFTAISKVVNAEKKAAAERKDAETDASNAVTLARELETAQLASLARQRRDFEKDLTASRGAEEAAAAAAVLQAQGKEFDAIQNNANRRRVIAEQTYQDERERVRKLGYDKEQAWQKERDAFAEKEAALTRIAVNESEQRRQAIEAATSKTAAALSTLGTAGSGFEQLVKQLGAAQFVQQTEGTIKALLTIRDAVAAGDQSFKRMGVSVGEVDAAIRRLRDAAETALAKGVAPAAKATQAEIDNLRQSIVSSGSWLASFGAAADPVIRDLTGMAERTGDVGEGFEGLKGTVVEVNGVLKQGGEGLGTWITSLTQIGDASKNAKEREAEMTPVLKANAVDLGQVGTEAEAAAGGLDHFAQSADKAKEAAKGVDDALKGHSLIPTLQETTKEMLSLGDATDRWHDSTITLIKDIGEADSFMRSFRQSTQRSTEEMISSGPATTNAGKATPFWQGVSGGPVGSGGRIDLGSFDLATLLAQNGRNINLGFGIQVKTHEAIEQILKAMKAQQQAQQMVNEFLDRVFNPKKLGGVVPGTPSIDPFAAAWQQFILAQQPAAIPPPPATSSTNDMTGGVAGPQMGGGRSPVNLTVNVTQNQSPMEIVRTILPIIRRELARGTL